MSFSTNNFVGGMNDWLDPSLLSADTASFLSNADVSNGKIVPIKGVVLQENKTPTDYGHYGNRYRSVVKYYNRYYWSNNTASTSPYYGGNPENFLGMPYPAYSGTGQNVTISAVSPGTGQTGLTGKYKYCVTFVSANGWEGAPGSLTEYEASISLNSQCGQITVTWNDSRISYAKIFRTIANGADFYNVGEVQTSGGTFTDDVQDSSAQMMNPLDSQDNYPPPDGGKFLTEYGGVFFLAVEERLYFSRQGNPHAWPTLQFLSVDDTITGIAPEFQGVLVFTKNKAYRITGADDVDTITRSYLPGNHGCINFRSISVVNNSPLWVSNDGLCLWDGESISVVNYGKVKIEYPQLNYSVAARDKYYLFLNNGTIVFDRKNGDIFLFREYVINYAWYDGNTDILYFQVNNSVYIADAGNEMSITYQSPYIGADTEGIKKFTEAIITVSDPATAVISIPGTEEKTVSLAGGRNRIKLGLDCIGRWLQITIRGKTTVSEVHVIY